MSATLADLPARRLSLNDQRPTLPPTRLPHDLPAAVQLELEPIRADLAELATRPDGDADLERTVGERLTAAEGGRGFVVQTGLGDLAPPAAAVRLRRLRERLDYLIRGEANKARALAAGRGKYCWG